MRNELNCQEGLGRRIDFCADYGKSECPKTCFYSIRMENIQRRERAISLDVFEHLDNFDIGRVGE